MPSYKQSDLLHLPPVRTFPYTHPDQRFSPEPLRIRLSYRFQWLCFLGSVKCSMGNFLFRLLLIRPSSMYLSPCHLFRTLILSSRRFYNSSGHQPDIPLLFPAYVLPLPWSYSYPPSLTSHEVHIVSYSLYSGNLHCRHLQPFPLPLRFRPHLHPLS